MILSYPQKLGNHVIFNFQSSYTFNWKSFIYNDCLVN